MNERSLRKPLVQTAETSPKPAVPALERLRETMRVHPSFRTSLLMLTLQATAIGAHFAEKAQIAAELKADDGQLDKKIRQLEAQTERLQVQYQQLDELFGRHSPFQPNQQLTRLKDEQAVVSQDRQNFNWLEGAGPNSPIAKFIRSLTQPTEPVMDRETLIASTDITTADAQVTPEQLQELFVIGFPQGWIDAEIASIRQVDYSVPMPATYGKPDGSVIAGECSGGAGAEQSSIVLTDAIKDMTLSDLVVVLAHEFGHANDWLNDIALTEAERVTLLLAVSKRIDDPDRFQSSYVESIRNPDVQLTRYLKAAEYWAEISARYMVAPDQLHIKDFELVDGVVKRSDPHFRESY